MMSDVLIWEETAADHEAIRQVNRLAFGQDDEARLVDQLRADGLVVASLVAVHKDSVVGHILFTELPIDTLASTVKGVALAPMAVIPALQRRGIGTALVERGLQLCQERGKSVVVVVGHPTYYPRFGFSAEKAANLQSPFEGSAFMALELIPGALQSGGTVRYPAAFGLVD